LLLQFDTIFPQARNAKKLRCFNFLYCHYCWNLNFDPTGACCKEEWNNLVASKCRLATNHIFSNVLVPLIIVKYWFPNCSYIILYPQPWSVTGRYPSFIGHQN